MNPSPSPTCSDAPNAGALSAAGGSYPSGADIETLTDQLRVQLWRRSRELEGSREELRAARSELESMGGSMSWRLTSPMRVVSRRTPKLSRALRSVIQINSHEGRSEIAAVVRTAGQRATKLAYWTVTRQLHSRLRERRAGDAGARDVPVNGYAEWIAAYDTFDEHDLAAMGDLARGIAQRPLVSIVMPVFDAPERMLREAIDSVRAQVYDCWELCIADDASTKPHVRRVLDEYATADLRIRVVERNTNGGISVASNAALALAKGELLGFVDHDDLLRPHALLLAVLAFGSRPDAALVYSDEDRIDEEGQPLGHFFKPDWSPALILAQNYVCHFSVYRTELVRAVGGLRPDFDGSQDWDLLLRVAERVPVSAIVHVPHVLYRWRATATSAAATIDAKPYAIDAGRRAVEDYLVRTGCPGVVSPVGIHQTVRFVLPSPRPLVSVIVPSTGRLDLLEPCIAGLLSRTEYEALEILVVLSSTTAGVVRRTLDARVAADPRVRFLSLEQPRFNFSVAINRAVAESNGPLLLLLNDDTEVVDGEWLETLVGWALQERVGAVGSLLVYSDDTIQSAGMLIGARGAAEHRYHRRPAGTRGYANRAILPQDVSALAATCALVRREAFDEVGGLDELYPVCYGDIDFCLRLRQGGWRVVYAPPAVLRHRETASFGTHQRGREPEHLADLERLRNRWGEILLDDPMHNPNLALDAANPSQLAFPPRVTYPWRRGRVPALEPS